MQEGNTGVDIFFALSGFLIGIGLMREMTQKNGDYDYYKFIMNRSLRLMPMIIVHLVQKALYWKDHQWRHVLATLTYTNNMADSTLTHLWSVSVEMQLYLISPFLMSFMFKRSSGQWTVPFTLAIVNLICNVALNYWSCPQALHDNSKWNDKEAKCMDFWSLRVYSFTPCRMAPYAFGLYAAYIYHQDQLKETVTKLHWLVDYAAFLITTLVAFFGTWISSNGDLLPAEVHFAYTSVARLLFGSGTAYMMLRVL